MAGTYLALATLIRDLTVRHPRHGFGADQRVVLTHSTSLHTAQSRAFDQTLAKATRALAEVRLTSTIAA